MLNQLIQKSNISATKYSTTIVTLTASNIQKPHIQRQTRQVEFENKTLVTVITSQL